MTIGIAVVGAGMAGKAHAAAYRVAPTLYESTLPDLRYVSTGDMNAEAGRAAAATAMSAATRTGGPSPTTPTSRWSASSSRTACTSRWSGGSSRPASTCCARNRSPTPWPRHGRWPTWPGRPSPWFVSASPTAASFHQDTPSQVAVVRELGSLILHAAAKDVRINAENARLNGVLDNGFRRLSPDEPRVNLGGGEWANEWPKDSSWDFVPLGKGHDMVYRTEFIRALHDVDPDMCLNIEHEDTELGRIEGLQVAADVLKSAWAAFQAG